MSKLFKSVKVKRPRTNVFDLSHERKFSMNMGKLVPILVQEIVPGDKFRVNSESMVRLAPMLAPLMHRVNVYTHFFFVPNRIIWDNWETFITGGPTGTSLPTFPQITYNNANKAYFAKQSLADYMGLPIPNAGSLTQSLSINSLPFRAYTQIYNDYYRDPNLTVEIGFSKGDTVPSLSDIMTLRNRCWEKDYYTSALPWTQRGGQVSLPVTAENEVTYLQESNWKRTSGSTPLSGNIAMNGTGKAVDSGSQTLMVENIDSIDTTFTGVDINALRQALRLQEWLEKNARGGGRYIEQILSHFGVVSDDARLQRAEYLGGGKSPIVVSEVLNTGDDTAAMYGHGMGVGNTNSFSKFFKEHGYVIGIMSILPRTAYQQGVEKMWIKDDKFDFYFPEFANLGEQDVKNYELYWDGTQSGYNSVFGYQSRYSEYKYKQSSVHGDFRDNLNYWHLGRIFANAPALNTSFVEADPSHRVFKVTDAQYHKLYVQVYNNVQAIRPMPFFGTPTI